MPKGLLFLWNTPELHAAGAGITAPLGVPAEGTPTTAQPLPGQQPGHSSCSEGLGCLSLTLSRAFVSHPSVTALYYPTALPSNTLFLRSFSSKPSYKQCEIKTQLQFTVHVVDRTLYGCVDALCILLLQPCYSAILASSHSLSMVFLLPTDILVLPLQALISTASPSQKCQQNTAKKFPATTRACQLCTSSVIFPGDQERPKLPSYTQKESQHSQLDVSVQEALRQHVLS